MRPAAPPRPMDLAARVLAFLASVPARFPGPVAAAAILVVAVWHLDRDRGVLVGRIPLLFVAALLLAGFAGGAGLVRSIRAPTAIERRAPTLLTVGATVTGAAILVQLLREPTPRLQIATLIVFGVAIGAVGMFAAIRERQTSLLQMLLVAEVLAFWLAQDAIFWNLAANHFYDLRVYLAAGVHANAGQPVYLTAPLAHLPSSAANDYFLYPPPLIPLLQAASRLPLPVTEVGFTLLLVACALGAFRLLGVTWGWAALLVALPPLMKGIETGNVANLTLLLFVVGWRFGSSLIVGPLFKVQNAIPAAWLARERRWRGIGVGLAVLAAIVLLTLPLVGTEQWTAWAAGLGYRQQSQVNVPILYGDSPARVMPSLLYVAVSGLLVVAALVFPGRRGLAGLGVASIFASPSLWPHGFIMALPAVLAVPNGALVWLVLGLQGNRPEAYWLLALVGAASVVFGRWDRASVGRGPLHPLGATNGPWPDPGDRPPRA